MSIIHHIKKISPANVISARDSHKVLLDFAESNGLVYFGYVNQRTDEHRLVRGITLSPTHIDNDYCIGTYHNYDCVMVRRNDTVRLIDGREQHMSWLITAVDLQLEHDIPHIFIGHNTRKDVFLAKHSQLSPVTLGTFGAHSQQFTLDYTVYASPTNFVSVQRLLTPQFTEAIAKYCPYMSIEISDGVVYLYSVNHKPEKAVLEKNLSLGVWLAQTVDNLAAN